VNDAWKRWRSDARAARLFDATLCALVGAWAWRRPVGVPMRGPAIVLAIVATMSAFVAAARSSSRPLARGAAITRSAVLVFVAASWDGPPWWMSAMMSAAIGVADGRSALAEERSLAGVALGGAIAVGWNAWRFGAPASRVFAVAMCAAAAAAACRGRGQAPPVRGSR
jgi:hypothetical protein